MKMSHKDKFAQQMFEDAKNLAIGNGRDYIVPWEHVDTWSIRDGYFNFNSRRCAVYYQISGEGEHVSFACGANPRGGAQWWGSSVFDIKKPTGGKPAIEYIRLDGKRYEKGEGINFDVEELSKRSDLSKEDVEFAKLRANFESVREHYCYTRETFEENMKEVQACLDKAVRTKNKRNAKKAKVIAVAIAAGVAATAGIRGCGCNSQSATDSPAPAKIEQAGHENN